MGCIVYFSGMRAYNIANTGSDSQVGLHLGFQATDPSSISGLTLDFFQTKSKLNLLMIFWYTVTALDYQQ